MYTVLVTAAHDGSSRANLAFFPLPLGSGTERSLRSLGVCRDRGMCHPNRVASLVLKSKFPGSITPDLTH